MRKPSPDCAIWNDICRALDLAPVALEGKGQGRGSVGVSPSHPLPHPPLKGEGEPLASGSTKR